eukprot:scaffold144824_cov362-Phaeocystis_antarctica.AAC.2
MPVHSTASAAVHVCIWKEAARKPYDMHMGATPAEGGTTADGRRRWLTRGRTMPCSAGTPAGHRRVRPGDRS